MRRTHWGREPRNGQNPVRVLGILVLASVTVMVLDANAGSSSPLDAVRTVVGDVVGPVETVTDAAARPFTDLKGFVRTNSSLRKDVSDLKAENAKLRSQLATEPVDRNRLAELDGLTRTVDQTGYSLVAARVVAMGPMQSFSRTVTIDAGTTSGITKDLTVINNDGLVGRVVSTTLTTATVLLVVDTSSVVGGRLGTNLEIGFLRGRGSVGDDGTLALDLVDTTVVPSRDDVVVTWGSRGGVPYVAGIPIGRVESVISSPRQSSRMAVIKPFVNFSALDVVGVVVPKGTKGDRPLLTAGSTPGSTSGSSR